MNITAYESKNAHVKTTKKYVYVFKKRKATINSAWDTYISVLAFLKNKAVFLFNVMFKEDKNVNKK